eukprot:scaffold36619_cov283-Amphora_coffeaeformis.AAC.1
MSSRPSTDSESSASSRLRTTQTEPWGETTTKRPPEEPSLSPTTAPFQTGVNQQGGTYNIENLQVSGGKTSNPCNDSGRGNDVFGGQHVSGESTMDPEDHAEVICREHQHQKQRQGCVSDQAKSKTEGNKKKGGPLHIPPTKRAWQLIEPWHIVLGDTHARTDRTTAATHVLRKIKEEFKKKYKGNKKSSWIPLAIHYLYQQLLKEFPDVPREEVGRVLVRCTSKSLIDGRVKVPNEYGYLGDDEPRYGTAVADRALEFFLESRDAPNLANELARHFQNLRDLRQNTVGASDEYQRMLERFLKTLNFFQDTLDEANRGDVLADKLLESLKPINALKHQWIVLIEHKPELSVSTPRDESGVRKSRKNDDYTDENASICSNTDSNASQNSSMGDKHRRNEMNVAKAAAPKEKAPIFGSTSKHPLVPSHEDVSSPRLESASALIQMKQMQPPKIMSQPPGAVTLKQETVGSEGSVPRSVTFSHNESFRFHKTSSSSEAANDDGSHKYLIGKASQHRDSPLPKRAKSNAATGQEKFCAESPQDGRATVLSVTNFVATHTSVFASAGRIFPWRDFEVNRSP